MKKLIICFVFASSLMMYANTNTEKININKENGSCTVTITYRDSYGDTFSGTGTAETCSEARTKAYADLSKKVISAE